MNENFAEFNSTILLVIKGLAVGILAFAPMGPVGILCIQRTIQKGRIYGLATGAGAALSDFIYALLTGLGMDSNNDVCRTEQSSGHVRRICQHHLNKSISRMGS